MVAVRMSFVGAAFVALSLSLWPMIGHAYTPEEDQACRGDAFRLCSSEIPDVDRITACMERKKSQLSPECRRFFGPSRSVSVSKPSDIKPAAARKSKSKLKKAAKPAAT